MNIESIIELLGSGLQPAVVAQSLGITQSYISQILADPENSKKVQELRFVALSKHNKHDDRLDALEEAAVDKLEQLMQMVVRPETALAAFKVLNSAVRRGAPAIGSVSITNQVVNLTVPAALMRDFVSNATGQIVKAGDQELVTIPSTKLNTMMLANRAQLAEDAEVQNEHERTQERSLATTA